MTINNKIVAAQFESKFKAISKNIDEAFVEIGERGVGYLKRQTPVDSGRLRNSMSFTVDNKVYSPLGKEDNVKMSKAKDAVYIGTNVIYAPHVEYLSTNGSQGFMQRAYEQTKKRAKEIFSQAMGARR